MSKTYREIRRHYIKSRTDEILADPGFSALGNRRKAAKEQACAEFDDFANTERHNAVKAVNDAIEMNTLPDEQRTRALQTLLKAQLDVDNNIPAQYPKSRLLTLLLALWWDGWRPVAKPKKD